MYYHAIIGINSLKLVDPCHFQNELVSV